MLAADLVVVSSGPENNFGAAKAHSSYLFTLRSLGARSLVVSSLSGAPHVSGSFQSSLPGDRRVVPPVRSDAYPDCGVARALAAGEEMFRLSMQHAEAGASVLLLGTFLFPFCWSVLQAARMLQSAGVAADVVVVPAGSDIWQIGRQLPQSAAAILQDPLVSSCVTYSRTFAEEIARSVASDVELRIIPPAINIEHFRPGSIGERREARRRLAIEPGAVVLVNCSNMRPIKNLGLTLTLAQGLAQRLSVKVELLLVGPMTTHLSDWMRKFWPAAAKEPGDYSWANLKVRFLGLQMDTRPYYWAADFAINTSRHDSFNISLAESLACELPIVSTDVVGLRELPNAEDVGHFFAIDTSRDEETQAKEARDEVIFVPDIEAILEWVEPLIKAQEPWRKRKAAARALAESYLAPEVIREKWRLLLSELHVGTAHQW